MRFLKYILPLFILCAVGLAQIPVKVGSLTQVANAPGNSVILLTVPGVTNFIIPYSLLQQQILGNMSTNTVVISNAYVTNLTVINQIDFAGHNATVGYVWTCTNATTGAGEWQAVTISGTGITNLVYDVGANTTNWVNANTVFTNDGSLIYRSGYTPSNNASFLIRASDGSRFYGSNQWADPFDYYHKTSLYTYSALNFSTSNDYPSIVGEIYSKDWLNGTCLGIHRIGTYSDGASAIANNLIYAAQGGKQEQWYTTAHPNFGSLFTYTSNSTVWFAVSNGDLVTIKAVNYTWPDAHAAGALTDDGSGVLSWTPLGAVAITNIAGGTNINIRIDGGTNFIDFTGTYDMYVTNITVFSNAFFNNVYVTNLNVISNAYINNLYATNLLVMSNAIVKGNVYISQTNFVNFLVVSNIAQFDSNIYVAGTAFINHLLMTNAALSISPSASNSPAENEFPNAHWVRSLFNNGLILYNSTNVFTDATNVSEGRPMNAFTNTIPETARKHYPLVNLGDYIGSVIATNTFTSLQGPILVHSYLEMTNGLGGPAVSVHPEIYWSLDRTNWGGDFTANDQALTTGTNLYQWVISFPTITAAGSNFWIQRRFKIGSVAGATHPGVVVHTGTNFLSGINDASHIAISGTGGGGGTGTTTVIVTNFGTIVTNVEYVTNFITDLANVQNDYYMTNSMTNHIFVLPTNMFSGLSWTMSLQGAASYTNFMVYFSWPPSVTVTWLSLTNGDPTTTISSNKMQFYSFKCRASSTTTQVVAAFKEAP